MKKLIAFLRKNQISWIQVRDEIFVQRENFNEAVMGKIEALKLQVVELDTHYAVY